MSVARERKGLLEGSFCAGEVSFCGQQDAHVGELIGLQAGVAYLAGIVDHAAIRGFRSPEIPLVKTRLSDIAQRDHRLAHIANFSIRSRSLLVQSLCSDKISLVLKHNADIVEIGRDATLEPNLADLGQRYAI